jgi:peroxiredoxin
LVRRRPERHDHRESHDRIRLHDMRAAGRGSVVQLGCMLPRITLPGLPSGPIDLHERWGSGASLILSSLPGVSAQFGGLQRHLARLRSWQRREPEFNSLGYELAFVCAQTLDEQRVWLKGSGLGVTQLSDVDFQLAAGLRLPTIQLADGRSVYSDLTLVLHGAMVGQVFYGGREPQNNPETVLRFLRQVHGA